LLHDIRNSKLELERLICRYWFILQLHEHFVASWNTYRGPCQDVWAAHIRLADAEESVVHGNKSKHI